MAWPAYSAYQIAKDLTNNTSLVTSPPWYTGDFRLLTISVSTQSNAAINVQMSNAEGIQGVVPEASWINVLPISVQSIFPLTTIGRWSRTSSPASSNATIIFTGRT
jgi:hypothetical protein